MHLPKGGAFWRQTSSTTHQTLFPVQEGLKRSAYPAKSLNRCSFYYTYKPKVMLLYFWMSLTISEATGSFCTSPNRTTRSNYDAILPNYLASISPVVDDFDFFSIGRSETCREKKNLKTHPHTLAHPVGPESPDNRGSGRSQLYCHKTRDCHKQCCLHIHQYLQKRHWPWDTKHRQTNTSY